MYGKNPQSLVDQIVRNKVYSNIYWKEKLAGVNALDIIDRAEDVKYIAGTYGGMRKPSKFLCLLIKLLQINPEKDIVLAFIQSNQNKYLRALAMVYLRLVGAPEDIYTVLERLLMDSRKLAERNLDGTFQMVHVDELADKLLHEEIIFDIVLPRIPQRDVLEEMGKLEPKVSPLEEELEKMLENGDFTQNDKKENSNQQDDERSDHKDKELSKKKSIFRIILESKKDKSKKKKDKKEKKEKKEKKHRKSKSKYKNDNSSRSRSRSRSGSPKKTSVFSLIKKHRKHKDE